MADRAFELVYARFVDLQKQQLREKFTADADLGGELARRKRVLVLSTFLPPEGDEEAIEKLTRLICQDSGWELRFDTPDGADLRAKLAGLVSIALRLAREKIVADLDGRPLEDSRDQVLGKMGADFEKRAKAGASVAELFELYVTAMRKQNRKSADTLGTERKVIAQFSEFVGAARDVGSVKKPEVREFRNALAEVPVKWTSRNDLKGLTLREAASAWKAVGGPVRNDKTIVRELSGLSAFYTWLVREGYAEDNPTRDLAPRVDRKADKFPPYSNEKLRVIFASALFNGSSPHQGQEHVCGNERINDWRYWLPLCVLYSGARTSEIAQLDCDDVRKKDGTWVFDISESYDDNDHDLGLDRLAKRVKSVSSRRTIPVHPVLVELGFLRHIDQVRLRGSARLFPEIKPCARGSLSTQPSKFWQRYLKRLGLKEKGLALHSFRHTFADECRVMGASDGIIGSILGHATTSMTGHYGITTEGNLAQRCEAIARVSYENLHSHLGGVGKR